MLLTNCVLALACLLPAAAGASQHLRETTSNDGSSDVSSSGDDNDKPKPKPHPDGGGKKFGAFKEQGFKCRGAGTRTKGEELCTGGTRMCMTVTSASSALDVASQMSNELNTQLADAFVGSDMYDLIGAEALQQWIEMEDEFNLMAHQEDSDHDHTSDEDKKKGCSKSIEFGGTASVQFGAKIQFGAKDKSFYKDVGVGFKGSKCGGVKPSEYLVEDHVDICEEMEAEEEEEELLGGGGGKIVGKKQQGFKCKGGGTEAGAKGECTGGLNMGFVATCPKHDKPLFGASSSTAHPVQEKADALTTELHKLLTQVMLDNIGHGHGHRDHHHGDATRLTMPDAETMKEWSEYHDHLVAVHHHHQGGMVHEEEDGSFEKKMAFVGEAKMEFGCKVKYGKCKNKFFKRVGCGVKVTKSVCKKSDAEDADLLELPFLNEVGVYEKEEENDDADNEEEEVKQIAMEYAF